MLTLDKEAIDIIIVVSNRRENVFTGTVVIYLYLLLKFPVSVLFML